MTKNWRGMPSHPMDSHMHWQSDNERILLGRKLYDKVIAGNATQKEVDELLDFVGEEHRIEAYWNAEAGEDA
jgi:hypothetical protein